MISLIQTLRMNLQLRNFTNKLNNGLMRARESSNLANWFHKNLNMKRFTVGLIKTLKIES